MALASVQGAETQLTYTGIPYVLSIYGALVIDALEHLQADGKYDGKSPSRLMGGELHEKLRSASGERLPQEDADLFEYLNAVRNRIIHHAGLGSGHLLRRFVELNNPAHVAWQEMSGQRLAVQGENHPLALNAQDLIGTLALTDRLGRAVNEILRRSLSKGRWAEIVIDDFRGSHARQWGDPNRRGRALAGFVRHAYPSLTLAEQEFAAAMAAARNQ